MNRAALLLAGLMCAASAGAMLARPTTHLADESPPLVLAEIIPKQFAGWKEDPQRIAQVVNPQTQQLLDRLYSQILTRDYVNGTGYRIMLSIAYGGDQREGLEAHKPEVCYPAQGFAVVDSQPVRLLTPFGPISARRLFATQGGRKEPVTYWYTVGKRSVGGGLEKKWVEMRLGLTGRIPDGLLFRVSSLDPDRARAHRLQDDFIARLLAAVPPPERQRLSGLGEGMP